jgi:lactate permease
LDALTYTLIFDTTPVAFGALGIPVTTLATITGLPVMKLSAMMGRQLPLLSLFLPIYALTFYAGKVNLNTIINSYFILKK